MSKEASVKIRGQGWAGKDQGVTNRLWGRDATWVQADISMKRTLPFSICSMYLIPTIFITTILNRNQYRNWLRLHFKCQI